MEGIKSLSQIAAEWEHEESVLSDQVSIDDNFITFRISYEYPIELERVDTPEKILRWIVHLSEKPWIDKRHLHRFIQLACKRHNIKIDMP